MAHQQHLSAKQIKSLRKKLIDMKQDLERRIEQSEHMGLAVSFRDETGDLSMIDNHPGDLATEMYEREKDISLLENEELLLMRIQEALRQMELGTYGSCHTCHEPIPFARLEAIPFTLYCVQHSPEQTVSERRPIEEQFLYPPFGRTSLDEDDTQNGFDGEDAWQIVESWGSSNTPAMAEDPNIDDYDLMAIEAAEELDGCVESYESFLATDLYGQAVFVVRNREYHKYLKDHEGDDMLESPHDDPTE